MMRPSNPLLALLLSVAGLSTACAAGSSSPGGQGGAFGTSTSTTLTTATTTGAGGKGQGGGGGGGLFDGGGSDAPVDPDAGCGLLTVDAKNTPLALYVALGKSSSMYGSKWDGAKAGLGAFLADPASAGIKVALNFFPLDKNPTCDAMAYKPPVVDFGLLPANAMAITAALNAQTPNGFFTPIYPALGGALLACLDEEANSPGDAAAVLLITDGAPNGPAATCGGANPDDPAAIAMLAAMALLQNPPAKTFVIGLPGVNQAFANQVAAAGGTDSAILVTVAGLQAEFEKALAKVRGLALPCAYDLPAQVGPKVDVSHVNVLITPGGGQPSTLPQNASCSGASGVGWYYDNPAHPQHIELCAGSCTSLKALSNAKVQIVLGCQTVLK